MAGFNGSTEDVGILAVAPSRNNYCRSGPQIKQGGLNSPVPPRLAPVAPPPGGRKGARAKQLPQQLPAALRQLDVIIKLLKDGKP